MGIKKMAPYQKMVLIKFNKIKNATRKFIIKNKIKQLILNFKKDI